MSSAWEFLKRHKGKFFAAGAVVGAAVAAKSAIDADLLGIRNTAAHEVQLSQARRHFLFDAHQQSCDKALIEAIIDIKQILKSRYPVEQLVESLKESPSTLSSVDKIRIWEDIKHKSIARVVSTAFAYSLVIIASKTQKSIVCAETCNAVASNANKPTEVDVLTRLATLVFGGAPAPKPTQPLLQTDTRVQQVFINCIQFLTTSGFNEIFHTIDTIVEEQLVLFALDKKVTTTKFEELFFTVVQQVENLIGSRNYANFIVPQILFDNSKDTKLEQLLAKFVQVLELRRCHEIIQDFVQRFITGAVEFLRIDLSTVEQPVAKCLPAIADAFTIITRNSYESIFQNCLHSSELHQFTLVAFTAESVEQPDVSSKRERSTNRLVCRTDDFALD